MVDVGQPLSIGSLRDPQSFKISGLFGFRTCSEQLNTPRPFAAE